MTRLFNKHRWLAIVLTTLMAIEIFYFSTLQGTTGGIQNIWLSYAYHFIAFFLLAFFLFNSIKGNKKLEKSHIILTGIISLLYSISDEIHQLFVPLRDASIGDIFTDSLGICFALFIGFIINKKTNAQS